MFLAVGVVFGGLVGEAQAATINAESCEQADVQAAINTAVSGDIVMVPSGICTWSTHTYGYPSILIKDKTLTIMGAGKDATIILSNANGSRPPASKYQEIPLIISNSSQENFTRISGFTFGAAENAPISWEGFIQITGKGNFRIDNCKFDNPTSRGIFISGEIIGVIDSSEFIYSLRQGIFVNHGAWASGSYGDGSWSSSLDLGTANAVYVENCNFEKIGTDTLAAIDAGSGARYVFRHNTVKNSYVINHGTETSGRLRSGFSVEIYGNNMSHDSNWWTGVNIRGGTGVIYDNVMTGYGSTVVLQYFRSSASYGDWGKCDGTSIYDGNIGPPDGYPCIDQIGRSTDSGIGTTQLLAPLYSWGNTLDGNSAGSKSGSPHVVEGRDFFNDVQMPGYVAYTYPHPLRLEDTPSPNPIPGDINKDGIVNIFDYNIFLQNFGATDCGNVADLNGDCNVNIFDYNIFLEEFGKTSSL